MIDLLLGTGMALVMMVVVIAGLLLMGLAVVLGVEGLSAFVRWVNRGC